MRNRGAIRRLESKLGRLGADWDAACEDDDPPFICVHPGPNLSSLAERFFYVTFLRGNVVEFYFADERDEWSSYYNLELHEDAAFGRHLRHALKWLGY